MTEEQIFIRDRIEIPGEKYVCPTVMGNVVLRMADREETQALT